MAGKFLTKGASYQMRHKQFTTVLSLGFLLAFLFSGGLARADAQEGRIGVLSNQGYHSVPAGRDEASLNEFYRLVFMVGDAGDPSGERDMKKMLEDGQIVWIPNGTSVRIVQVGSFSSEVEVLSGQFKDRLLYVPGKFVVKPEKRSK
jgi:hypothetical protein